MISTPFHFRPGNTPLLVSIPHAGLKLTDAVATGLSERARVLPDTDWYVPALYPFLEQLGVGLISANYSRYVIDLNRPEDDQPLYQSKTTGLFPQILFDSSPLFETGKEPDAAAHQQALQQIWQPYQGTIESELQRLKAEFGYALLFDAHSIAAEVPMLFEGTLPDFNLGNNSGDSCAAGLVSALQQSLERQSRYSHVLNGRFKGGYITRHFGRPERGIHAVQLELSQATYLRNHEGYELDTDKLQLLQPQLQRLIEAMLAWHPASTGATSGSV